MNHQLTPEQLQYILCKFIINLPREELEDPSRLSYHAEKAFYYYLDHIAKGKQLKDWMQQRRDFFSSLKDYAPSFLKINPSLLSDKLLENKPVCGAIIFNRENSKVLVVKVGDKFGFPKGKINQGERLEQCAIRQAWEETGINISGKIDSRFFIDFYNHDGRINFFVARGIPEEERIRVDSHEVDEVTWMRIQDLRRDMATKFAQRSKIAWALFQNMNKSYTNQFMPKYFKGDSQSLDFQMDPLRSFKFDTLKLQSIMSKEVSSRNTA